MNELPKQEEAPELAAFFNALNDLCTWYYEYLGKAPTILRIHPTILQRLSSLAGFYARPEIGSEVTAHAPIVRTLNLAIGTVTIQEDWALAFLALDDESIY